MRIRMLLLASVAALGVQAASAQMAAMPAWHHGEGMQGMEILHALNLTSVQQQKVHEILHASFAQAQPIEDQMRSLHQQMADAMFGTGTVTADQLQPLLQQKAQLRSQLDQIRLNAMLQIRSILTTDQLSHAADLHQKLAALHAQERQLVGQAQ